MFAHITACVCAGASVGAAGGGVVVAAAPAGAGDAADEVHGHVHETGGAVDVAVVGAREKELGGGC